MTTHRTHPEPARIKPVPAWKTVACPMCKAQPGESCGRTSGSGFWYRTAPHQWRKDAVHEPARIARDTVTLHERITELSKEYGSLRKAALALGVDAGYLSRLASGKKTDPGEELLALMGLRATGYFARIVRDERTT